MYKEVLQLLKSCSEDISIEMCRKDYIIFDKELKLDVTNVPINEEFIGNFNPLTPNAPDNTSGKMGSYISLTNKEGKTAFINIR